MNFFTNLFKSKSEIQNVSFFTFNDSNDFYKKLSLDLMTKEYDKNLDFLNNTKGISPISILNARKPDLSVAIHFISFMRKEGCEVVYFKDDKLSEELAIKLVKHFKKLYKDKEIYVMGLSEGDDGWNSISSLKNLKRKIFIKPENNESIEELSNLIFNFLGKI